MSYDKSERLLKRIDKSYKEYGKNRVFLVGKHIQDLFYKDIKTGALGVLNSLKNYVEETENFKWFIYINQKKVEFYKKNGEEKLEKTKNEDFLIRKNNALANKFIKNNSELKKRTEKSEEKIEEVENLENKIHIRVIESLLKETKREEALVYIEDFDWNAKFYDSEQDNEFIKKIIDLEALNKNLVIISMKKIGLLEEKFFQEYDDKEVLTIDAPSKNEIELILHRVSWKKEKQELKDLDYSMLAAQFSNSNYSLRECIKIFVEKINKYGGKLTIDNFEFKTKVEEKILWKDVILNKDLKDRLELEMKNFIEGKEDLKKGVILTGPPGTGKTHIAKAIANEGKVYFMCPKLSDLKGQYVGQSAPKIKALFEEARLNEPTLIFLDEVDTLFPLRDSDDGDSYTKDITNEFLQQLDGVDTGTQKIFILAATNRIESIDPAVKSRLGNPIEIDLPQEEERELLFKNNLKDVLSENFWKNLSTEYYKDLKIRSAEMSGRDIKNFCSIIKKILETKKEESSDNIYRDCFLITFRERKKMLIDKLKNTTGLRCLYPNDIQAKKLYGIDKIKNKISQIANQIKSENISKRKKFNLDIQNGVLLYGPPGNGKSEIVEEVARNENMILIKIESKDVIGYSMKETLSNLDTIFLQALQLSKVCDKNEGVIIFFDEFDALVGDEMTSALRGTILGKLADKRGIRNNETKLILIAATNFYNKIDEAVKRKGRFDTHLKLKNPTEDIALILIKEFLSQEKMYISSVDSEKLIKEFYEKIKGEQKDISSSYIKNEIIELKRFIIENYDVDTKINITETMLRGYLVEERSEY